MLILTSNCIQLYNIKGKMLFIINHSKQPTFWNVMKMCCKLSLGISLTSFIDIGLVVCRKIEAQTNEQDGRWQVQWMLNLFYRNFSYLISFMEPWHLGQTLLNIHLPNTQTHFNLYFVLDIQKICFSFNIYYEGTKMLEGVSC